MLAESGRHSVSVICAISSSCLTSGEGVAHSPYHSSSHMCSRLLLMTSYYDKCDAGARSITEQDVTSFTLERRHWPLLRTHTTWNRLIAVFLMALLCVSDMLATKSSPVCSASQCKARCCNTTCEIFARGWFACNLALKFYGGFTASSSSHHSSQG